MKAWVAARKGTEAEMQGWVVMVAVGVVRGGCSLTWGEFLVAGGAVAFGVGSS